MSCFCVPDSSSIIFSAKVELAGTKLIDLLDRQYKVVISKKVKEECTNRTRTTERDIKEDVDRFFDTKKADVICYPKYEACLKVVQRWFNKENLQKFNDLGEGEKHCTALTLYLNHVKSSRIVMLIDDFEVHSLIGKLVDQQKIGILESIPGLIVQYYNVNKTISSNHVLASLRNYFSISRNASYETSINKRLALSCRALGFDICQTRCLINKD